MSQMTDQDQINGLVAALPLAIAAGEDTLVRWIGDFAALNEDSTLIYDSTAIAASLALAGFRPTPEESASKERVTLQKHGPEAYRRRMFHFAYYFFALNRPVPEEAAQHATLYFNFTGANPLRLWEMPSPDDHA
jgi:hypothetical protein